MSVPGLACACVCVYTDITGVLYIHLSACQTYTSVHWLCLLLFSVLLSMCVFLYKSIQRQRHYCQGRHILAPPAEGSPRSYHDVATPMLLPTLKATRRPRRRLTVGQRAVNNSVRRIEKLFNVEVVVTNAKRSSPPAQWNMDPLLSFLSRLICLHQTVGYTQRPSSTFARNPKIDV